MYSVDSLEAQKALELRETEKAQKEADRIASIVQFRLDIAEGRVPPGPNAVVRDGHIINLSQDDKESVDNRDMRDPEALGIALAFYREEVNASFPPLSELCDAYVRELQDVPDYYEQDRYATAYIYELEDRAGIGDKFAQALLDYYQEHGNLMDAPTEPTDR
jgi:hypothetical protein